MAVAEATQHDMRAMDLALTIAERAASLDEVPVGAVVYDTRTGEVLTKAHNEVEQRGDATAHAELVAICRAMESIEGKRLTGYSLAVTLEPCCMCAGAIVHARLDRLVYGA
ncbi:MAG: nucleoside deaminase, partial [Planctomycetota bacterium]